ncbi:MAG: hypothetical protein AVDCRST_MAG30-1876 [uncultured Solirubrobacteraceae bacterium]|uniref:DUF2157 domain-containing protein n=1 Tax=uncultured Solirubrobacteraceae bacterium TaxID=1162706 RepID=A0A6J4SJ31_9ACTN|nr:MAG: hypothetical protein AVDCRST_MAG30-1876 [uncultured Solirubrobacteraceae bacterium]
MATDRIPARRLEWLEAELARWEEQGLLAPGGRERIAGGYVAGTRLRIVGLLLGLGAALLGAGLIWLVAANVEIDEVGPVARFTAVALLWLALVALGEATARTERFDIVAGPARALAVLAYGGAIFQAAQSLQVPAYEPLLVAAWALGGLLYAYATGSAAALVPAIVAGACWYAFALADRAEDVSAFVAGLAIPVPICLAAAAMHSRRATAMPGFARPWRALAALAGLVALFTVTLSDAVDGGLTVTSPLGLGMAAAVAAAITGVALGAPERRDEILAGTAAAGLALVLLAVVPADPAGGTPTGAQSAYTIAAALVFLAWAIAVAVAGAARDAPGLTNLAFAALLVFVAVQSFGLIAEIFSGAALLLAVGALLVGLGLALDRGRRRLLGEGHAT